jgi:hypothetical protein
VSFTLEKPDADSFAMTTHSLITPAMQQAIGQAFPASTIKVERGALLRFAQAIGEANPRFTGSLPDDVLVAPPTFLRSLTPSVPPLPDGASVPRVLDGGSMWEYTTLVCSGDRITAVTRLESLKERVGRLGPMLLALYVIEYINQHGEQAAVQRNTVVRY